MHSVEHYSDHEHGHHLPAYSHGCSSSVASMHSIDEHHHADHSDHEHGHLHADYKQNESMLHQLSAFGYDAEDITDAMEHVANPSDINQLVEYISAKDMKKMSDSVKSTKSTRTSFSVKPLSEWKSNKMTQGSDDHQPLLAESKNEFVFV